MLLKKGFTLIELLVSLALISIIVMGIFSVNLVMSNSNMDYGQKYLVKSQTQITMNHIINNATLAVGSATTINGFLDQGIIIGTAGLGNGDSTNNPNTFCIHQAANNNITNSASDIWLCYTWYGSSNITNPYQIFYCTMPYNTGLAYRGAGSCNSVTNPNITTGPTFLGTAYSISNLNGAVSQPSFVANTATNQLIFTITIQNCLNDALTSCNSTGISTDPPDNPEVQLTASASPTQEGM